ncbi:hypothetical protein OIO90_006024 [Microbotryomycetes sp. JL221]|nr:hypothetical protein OIO90_006024 [Microbotryomycetes sp. JL221]
MSLSKPPSHATDKPSILNDEVGKANRRAQGVVAGVAAGFLSGQATLRLFKQSRNASLLSGLISGAFVGYTLTQQSLKLHLAKAQQSHEQLRAHMSQLSNKDDNDAARWDMNRREPGSGGQELLEDPYATTRGDH